MYFGCDDDPYKDLVYGLVGYSITVGEDEVEMWSQSHLVDWERIISDEALLVKCGLSRADLGNEILLQVPLFNGAHYLTWGPHGKKHEKDKEEVFYLKKDCPHCTNGRCCFLHNDVVKLIVDAIQKQKGDQKRAQSSSLKKKEILNVPLLEIPDDNDEAEAQPQAAEKHMSASKKQASSTEETSSIRHTKPRVEDLLSKESELKGKRTRKVLRPCLQKRAARLAENFKLPSSASDLLKLAQEISDVPKIRNIEQVLCSLLVSFKVSPSRLIATAGQVSHVLVNKRAIRLGW